MFSLYNPAMKSQSATRFPTIQPYRCWDHLLHLLICKRASFNVRYSMSLNFFLLLFKRMKSVLWQKNVIGWDNWAIHYGTTCVRQGYFSHYRLPDDVTYSEKKIFLSSWGNINWPLSYGPALTIVMLIAQTPLKTVRSERIILWPTRRTCYSRSITQNI